jgi:hypothetical protein
MLELVSYGLTGLAAMVVMASCCAYGDELYLRGKRLIILTDKALGLRTGTIYRWVPSKSVPGVTLHA